MPNKPEGADGFRFWITWMRNGKNTMLIWKQV